MLRPMERPPASGIRQSPAQRVLVVDDSADSAELLGLLLEQAGHVVRLAATGSAAISVAPEFQPHVALVDISLPDTDGYALVGVLREQAQLKGCRFVAVTGYDGRDAVARSLAAGFDQHLVETLNLAAVVAAGKAGGGGGPPSALWSPGF